LVGGCFWGGWVFEGVCLRTAVAVSGCGVDKEQKSGSSPSLDLLSRRVTGRSRRSRRGWPGAETGGGRDVGWSARDLVLEGLLRADHLILRC
jgi:hypothetical protein